MRKHYKIIIFLLVLLISVGFAYLTANLDITGSITFKDNVWDVHLENIEVGNNSVDADTPVITDSNNLDFNITLTRPGDYYEFYVDVVNAGTMDATLDSITKTKLAGDYATYLNYTTTYYSDRAITKGDLLRSGLKERIKVRVEYKYDLDAYKKLDNIKLSFSLQYIKTDTHDSSYNELVWNFDSKAEEDVFTVPKTGTYKLEVWGAQGGTYTGKSVIGGYGGYSVGTITLSKSTKVYVNVGGVGHNTYYKQFEGAFGGYNGGGSGYVGNEMKIKDMERSGGGGGGATHIAYTSGLLSSLESVKGNLINNLYYNSEKILIVAGGGGGANFGDVFSDGGSGGGYTGVELYSDYSGSGGTQLSGGIYVLKVYLGGAVGFDGSFGLGGSQNLYWGPGGGGGFFGGSSAPYGSGGGGSGYIGNSSLTNKIMYCYNCKESTEETDETHIKTRSTTNVSEIPTSNYAKIGHGYARITFVG